MLNCRAYFWADLEFENGKVKGTRPGYIGEIEKEGPYDVIRVPFTALKRLAAEQGRRIELTELNAGSAPRVGTSRRGSDTWRPLGEYRPTDEVQEVTVVDGIRGLGAVATQVIRVDKQGTRSVWRGGPWK